MNETEEIANTTTEGEETATETAKAKPEKTPMVILDAQHFMEEVGKLVGNIPEGKTLEGFYNYFYSAMKAKFLESMGKRTNGCICGSDKDVIEWVQKYFSPEVKEGELVPEPKLGGVAIRRPEAKPKKEPTPEEIARKAAADAEKAKKKAEKEAKEAMKKKWQQQSFDFFSRYGV